VADCATVLNENWECGVGSEWLASVVPLWGSGKLAQQGTAARVSGGHEGTTAGVHEGNQGTATRIPGGNHGTVGSMNTIRAARDANPMQAAHHTQGHGDSSERMANLLAHEVSPWLRMMNTQPPDPVREQGHLKDARRDAGRGDRSALRRCEGGTGNEGHRARKVATAAWPYVKPVLCVLQSLACIKRNQHTITILCSPCVGFKRE